MISVFKTNVSTSSDVKVLQPLLDKYLKNAKWNFDLEDCDKILRIDSQAEILYTTIRLLQDNGYDCEELPD